MLNNSVLKVPFNVDRLNELTFTTLMMKAVILLAFNDDILPVVTVSSSPVPAPKRRPPVERFCVLTDPPVAVPKEMDPELIDETFNCAPDPVKKASALVERFVVLTDPPVAKENVVVPELSVETFN